MNGAFFRGFLDELRKIATTAPLPAPGGTSPMQQLNPPVRPPTMPAVPSRRMGGGMTNFPGQATTIPSSMGGMSPQPMLT